MAFLRGAREDMQGRLKQQELLERRLYRRTRSFAGRIVNRGHPGSFSPISPDLASKAIADGSEAVPPLDTELKR